jgi:dienelactone hydrolase
MIAISINILSLIAVSTVAALTLPAPVGKYGTASSVALLTDTSRQDPYASTSVRSLMVSSFYPAALRNDCVSYTSHYMPNATAAFYDEQLGAYGIPAETFTSLQLTHCKGRSQRDSKGQQFPVALFSPGLGNSRLIHSAMAQALASKGYIVITIDHPHDADIVEFPDGSTIFAADIDTDSQIEAALDVRTRDVSFVIDQLRSNQLSRQLLGDKVGISQKQYAIYGHSLGGATAAEAALSDTRLSAAINLDGTFFGSVTSCGAKTPLLIVAHDGKNLTTDPSWTSTWNATRKTTKAAVDIPNTAHGSYTDYPLIVDTLGIPAEAREQLVDLIGGISGALVRKSVSSIVDHFFGYAQCRENDPLPRLDGRILGGMRLIGKNEKARRCR